MKTRHLLFPVLCIICLLTFIACDMANTGPSAENADTATTDPDWCLTTCHKFEGDRKLEISAECDSCWQANFAMNDYQFPKVQNTSGDLAPLLGVHVKVADLREVLQKVDSLKVAEDSVELFAMFGIEIVNTKTKPKLIFQVEGNPKELSEDGSKETVEYFFDFTNPCPTYCPD